MMINDVSLLDISREINFNVTLNNNESFNLTKFQNKSKKFEKEKPPHNKNHFLSKIIVPMTKSESLKIQKIEEQNYNNVTKVELVLVDNKINKLLDGLDEENANEPLIEDKDNSSLHDYTIDDEEEDSESHDCISNENKDILLNEIFENNNNDSKNKDHDFINNSETFNNKNEKIIIIPICGEINKEGEDFIKFEKNEKNLPSSSEMQMICLEEIISKKEIKNEMALMIRLDNLAYDYQNLNSEKYLEEIEDIFHKQDHDKILKIESISLNLWEALMCLAFKYLENNDIKTHHLLSTILHSKVEKIYENNHLKIALAKFHYAKSIKDFLGNYSLSLNLFLEAVNLMEKAGQTNSELDLQIKFFLGNLYDDMGMTEESLKMLRVVLEQQIKLYTEEHIFTARTYNCLGIAEDSRGNLRQAREFYQKAYNLFKHLAYGLETIDSAKVMNNLAGIYFKWEDYFNCIKFYLKVLEVYVDKYGDDNSTECSYIGIIYNNLGNCYLMTKNNQTALNYFNKSCLIFNRLFGPSHPQTALIYKNLGDLHYNLEDYKQALNMYNLCVNTFLEKYGEYNDLYVSTFSKIQKISNKLI